MPALADSAALNRKGQNRPPTMRIPRLFEGKKCGPEKHSRGKYQLRWWIKCDEYDGCAPIQEPKTQRSVSRGLQAKKIAKK